MKILYTLVCIFFSVILFSQPAPDFVVTDSDGVEHSLYSDYLDEGKTVVLKVFFTTCPPCIGLAPWMEEKYQLWGAGEHDVEFIELSTQVSDSNADVAEFKETYGLTFPGVGSDGGSREAALPYQIGTYGPWLGTPSLVIISPEREVTYGFGYDEFDDLIAATGAQMPNSDQSTGYEISSVIASTSTPTSIQYILKPEGADMPQYDILALTGGTLDFDYPSTLFPEVENPVIVINVEGATIDGSINVLDILKLRKHILELEMFTTEAQYLAADVNSDGNVNVFDIFNTQKAILELIDEFPNNTPAWQTIPAMIPLTENLGNIEAINFTIVKTGNVD